MTTHSVKIEALLFVAGEDGLLLSDLSALTELSPSACQQQIDLLTEKYQTDKNSALTIIKTADKFRLTTKKEVADLLASYAKTTVNQSLSKSAIEVLSIIAYKQPITRLAIDQLRGVNSSGVLSTLRLFGLVEAAGHLEAPGRPTLYTTTEFFLDYMGINQLSELPPIAISEDLSTQAVLFEEEDENHDAHQ